MTTGSGGRSGGQEQEGEKARRQKAECSGQKTRDSVLCFPAYCLLPLPTDYLPKITQSPCAVAMKSSNGSDSHALVLDARNA